jgi:hypothetical protein
VFKKYSQMKLQMKRKHQMNATWRGAVADTGDMSKAQARLDFWRQLIARQQQSGMSVRVFCQQHRTSEYSFYHWRKRLREQLPMKFALVETSQSAPATVAQNYSPAMDRLRTVLVGEGLQVEVIEIEVRDDSAARELKFFGSPTIRVNGLDIEASSRQVSATGLACRCYPGGLPSDRRAAFRGDDTSRSKGSTREVTYDRGIESGAKRKQVGPARRGTHNACGSRRNRKRTGRIELLPADFAVYGGREPCREFDFSCGREAVSACRLASIHRLRVLSVVESEKMPASAKRDSFCAVVGLRHFRGDLNLLPPSDGKRSRRAARTVT